MPFGSSAPPSDGVPRRVVIASAAVLGLAGCTSSAAGASQFFTAHQAAVVEAATARLAPGPHDDPAEAGHPGAREAGVTNYIDRMLGQTPMIFAGGPWSNRHADSGDAMASFISPDPVTAIAWRRRLAGWRRQYTSGIATLDKLAGGDFAKAAPDKQDTILARQEVSAFTSLLFEHTVEGLYAVPEYGGNRNLVGWKDIGYPGDVQPRGYTADEVERSDGHDPVDHTGIVAEVLTFLGRV